MLGEDSYLHCVAVDPLGEPTEIVPGLGTDTPQPIAMPMEIIPKLRESRDFVEVATELLNRNPTGFYGEFEYDIYPLFINWRSDGENAGCLNLAQFQSDPPFGDQEMSMTYLSRTSEIGEGVINMFEGMTEIADMRSFVAHFPQRPLLLTVRNSDNELLSAAGLAFALAYFSDAWRSRVSNGEVANDSEA